MDGIFACLQKPKLGTQMGPKGTLHGEYGTRKKETQIRQLHGTSQFSKAIVPFGIHTILKHPTKIEFIMSIPLQIYQIYHSFAAMIKTRGRSCVANEHCCVVLKSSWFGRSSQTHLWT
jgi:hypothetical protein